MAYATWTEVKVFLPPDSQDSPALQTQAGDLLQPAYRHINARLGERYVTPIVLADSPNAYAWATDVHAKLVAGQSLVAVRALQGEEGEATWYADRLIKDAEDALTAAVAGTINLSDAVDSTDDGGEFRVTDGYSDLTSTEQGYIAPWFKRSDTW